MIGILYLPACTCVLQEGIDEREANEIILALAESGIHAEKVHRESKSESRFAVKVLDREFPQAWRVLQAAGLPRPKHEGFRNVFNERGIIPGRMEEQALFLSALQEEIARTLESVEGVVSVRIHTSVYSKNEMGQNALPPTASVLIGYQSSPNEKLPLSEQAVRKIVANAVVGLEVDRVAVVFTPRRRIVLPKAKDKKEGTQAVVKVSAIGVGCLALFLAVVFIFFMWRVARSKAITSSGG